jgi:Phytochelatin synthase
MRTQPLRQLLVSALQPAASWHRHFSSTLHMQAIRQQSACCSAALQQQGSILPAPQSRANGMQQNVQLALQPVAAPATQPGIEAVPQQPVPQPVARPVRPTFYKRVLPASCTALTSVQGREMFREALAAGTMEIYLTLADHYLTQDEPSFCGISTLAMVLNALSIDPGRVWKGSWRFFSERMLDCCTPIAVVEQKGIVIAQFACLARCNGAHAVVHAPHGDTSLEEVRSLVIDVCSRTDTDRVLVASYHRY